MKEDEDDEDEKNVPLAMNMLYSLLLSPSLRLYSRCTLQKSENEHHISWAIISYFSSFSFPVLTNSRQ